MAIRKDKMQSTYAGNISSIVLAADTKMDKSHLWALWLRVSVNFITPAPLLT